MDKKTSDSQLRASRNWESKNKERARYTSYRRTARLFIKSHADMDDLEELEKLIDERKNNI